jgi:hypothetical protein
MTELAHDDSMWVVLFSKGGGCLPVILHQEFTCQPWSLDGGKVIKN